MNRSENGAARREQSIRYITDRKGGVLSFDQIQDPCSFLLDVDKPIYEQEEKKNLMVATLFGLAHGMLASGVDEVSVRVPSGKLARLGLVSDETGKRISTEGMNHWNTLTMFRIDEGTICFSETYQGKQEHPGGHQLDQMVHERTTIAKNLDGSFTMSTQLGHKDLVLSFGGTQWQPISQKSTESEKDGVTSRWFNTTWALLFEGCKPGSLLAENERNSAE